MWANDKFRSIFCENNVVMSRSKKVLKQLEEDLKNLDFQVRYERGQFAAGYCLLLDRRVVLVNKFLDDEAKVESLSTILSTLYEEE